MSIGGWNPGSGQRPTVGPPGVVARRRHGHLGNGERFWLCIQPAIHRGDVDALVHGSGRYQPYLELVRAVERESLFDIRDAAEALMLSSAEINRALLRALIAARQLDGIE